MMATLNAVVSQRPRTLDSAAAATNTAGDDTIADDKVSLLNESYIPATIDVINVEMKIKNVKKRKKKRGENKKKRL